MASKITSFYIFNLLGRFLGLAIDFILVFFSAVIYAKAYYQISSLPVLLFSIMAYTYSLMQKSNWGLSLLSSNHTSIIVISFYTLSSISIIASQYRFTDNNFIYFILIAVVTFFSAILVSTRSKENENNLWLFPAAGFVSLAIGLIGAIFFNEGFKQAFLVVLLMIIIKPLIFYFYGKPLKSTYKLNKILLILIIFCGLRHLVLIIFRFYVPEDYLIEYSFNSRLIQNLYAFSILPAIYFLDKNRISKSVSNKSLTLVLISIITVFALSQIIQNIVILKIHLNWIIPMSLFVFIIIKVDSFVIKSGDKHPLRSLFYQLILSSFVLCFNIFYWLKI